MLTRQGGPLPATRAAVPPHRPLTLMVVEDDPGMASDLTGMLTAARHARLAAALVLKPYGGRDVLDAIARAVASGAAAS